MLVYFAIWIYMGLHYEQDVSIYWKTGPRTQGHNDIRGLMTRERFESIKHAFQITTKETT